MTNTSNHGEHLRSAAGDAKRQATETAEQVSRTAERQADDAIGRAGHTGHRVAEAIKAAADNLRDDNEWLANAANQLSDNVDRLSRSASEKGARGLKSELDSLARERPVLFMGAAVAAGVALGRLLRSSPEPQEPSSGTTPAGTTPSGPTGAYRPSATAAPGVSSTTKTTGI